MNYFKANLKKVIYIFSILILCIGVFSQSITLSYADEKKELDALQSKHIVLMDYSSGKILYQKNADSKIYPASTTKIWTAFCVLKKSKNLNEVIEIKDMPNIEGSSMYLENGEKFTVMQLLESLLIHSSNDVAYVLAKHFGDGNVNNFINFMNKEAAKYGATNTHFTNPHGLPDENHYTTALDMVNLSRVSYGNSVIRKIVSMKEIFFKKDANIKLNRHMYNSNKFLNSLQTIKYKGKDIPIKYDIIDGIKTGFTDDAGNCLVSTAQKNGIRLICGVFNAPGGSLYHDSRTLLDYGFDNFKNITILKKQDYNGEKSIKLANPSKISYSLASDFVITVPKNSNVNKKDYTTKYNFDNLKLPIKKGDVIGTVNVYEKGNMVSCIGLIAESDSQSWISYIRSIIPFLNGDEKAKKETSIEAKQDSKTDKESESKLDSQSESKVDSKSDDKSNSEQESKINSSENNKAVSDSNLSFIDKTKNLVTNSMNGFVAIFSDIGDVFNTYFNSDFFTNFEKSSFYQFLDAKISSYQKVVPAKIIIYGVPCFILLIIFLLIIGIIKDSIKNKRRKKKNNDG